MPPRATKALRELAVYAKRIDIYERDSVAEHVVNGISLYIRRAKAKRLSELVEPLQALCQQASYLGPVCLFCSIVSMLYEQAEDYGLDVELFRRAFENITKRLEITIENNSQQYLSTIDEQIVQGSTVLLLSYNSYTEKIVSTIRYKLDRVLIPVREPLKTGVGMALRLRKAGLNAFYVPDDVLSWAVSEADYILVDAIGSTSGGRILVDAGVEPALTMAETRDTVPLVLISMPASCEAGLDSVETLPFFTIESKHGGEPLRFYLVDVVDAHLTPYVMITENDAVEATRRSVRERQRRVREFIEDIVQFTLESLL